MKKFDILSAMTSQQIMQDSHVARVRALRGEVAALKEELARVRDERDSLREHFALALLGARDAEQMGSGGAFLIVDGWNAILSAVRESCRRREASAFPPMGNAREPVVRRSWRTQLADAVRRWLEERPADRAWIVFDGPRAGGEVRDRLRISYTGGTGSHRADRLVCDYLRMRMYDGARGHVVVATNDKDFRAEASRLGAETTGIEELNGTWALAIQREKRWIEK